MADRRNEIEQTNRRGLSKESSSRTAVGLSELSKQEMQTIAGGLQLTTESTVRFAARRKRVICADFDCSDGCCTA